MKQRSAAWLCVSRPGTDDRLTASFFLVVENDIIPCQIIKESAHAMKGTGANVCLIEVPPARSHSFASGFVPLVGRQQPACVV